MPVIKAEHLSKRFGKKVLAVDDVSFAIEPGTITGAPRPQRRRQDDHAAHDPRPRAARRRAR